MFLPRGLVVLKLLEWRGLARRLFKQMKRPAGALFVVVYVAMFAPAVLNSLLLNRSESHVPIDWVLRIAPLGIGMLCVLSMLAPELRVAFNFKPAEVDWLFTGPYSRRQLITYKLFGAAFGSLFMTVIFFLATFAFSPTRLPMFLGMYLAVLYATLFSTAYSMLVQAVSVRVKYLGYGIAAAMLGSLGYALFTVFRDLSNAAGVQRDPMLLAELVFQHPVIHWMRMPFVPFAHVMAADGGTVVWAMWTLLTATMVAALYAIILVLDADFMEAAMARSARQYAALERFKRGQFISERAITRKRRWSLPDLPRLGGFGPVAWRQLTAATHGWGRRIIELYVLCIVGGLLLRRYDVDEAVRDVSLPALMGILVYITVLGVNFVRFDFRSDIDVMDGLKTLPVGSRQIAAAQLVAPSLVLSAVYLAIGLGSAIAVNRPGNVIAIAVLALPFSALVIGMENVTFLLWPTRMAFQQTMDIQHVGRSFFVLMVKFLILAPALGLAVAAALACGFLLSSWTLACAVASAIMILEAALTIPAIAAAFEKFDPSTDTPP
ncbi:MAG: hypothetical protein HUU46_08870 [Candidatus Hydrogenedentes bacterium]|nr:hypothetical protein [Candidatus Hydrogenedentota bacterium]